jgi:hypothetical protein
MQQAMVHWIEAADARSALEQRVIVLVPRKSGVAVVRRLANLAMLLGMTLAVFSR